jgi:hypothetical protein
MMPIDIGKKVTSDIGKKALSDIGKKVTSDMAPTKVKENNSIEKINTNKPITAVALAIKSKNPKCLL